MTKGILLFAVQGTFDYISLAIKSAKHIRKVTDVPISIITNDDTNIPEELFDKIIKISETSTQRKQFYNGTEQSEFHTWNNFSRCLSYELTPYDHTLVLDVDYVINSDFLIKCFDIDKDFLIFKNGVDLAEWRDDYEFRYINQFSIPFYWATVFMFKKNTKTKHFFDIIKEIESNWDYFRLIYQITDPVYRNDFAFSIAIHIFHSSVPGNFIDVFPGKMYYSLDKDHLYKIKSNKMLFALQQDNRPDYVPLIVSSLDVHVMNKFDLLKVL